MSKITQETAQKIIDEYCLGSSTYELADKYSLWQTTICNLISGRSWAQCRRPPNIGDLIKSRHEKGHFKKGCKDHLHEQYPELTDIQMDITIGSMLGDGYLNKPSAKHPNSYFRKGQCRKYKEYVEWHFDQLLPFSLPISNIYSKEKLIGKNGLIVGRKKVNKFLGGYTFKTCSHPIFTKLREEWYPNGKKIVPLDLKLTPLSIAVWFCDDGCNNKKNRSAFFYTQSFTFEEAEFLCSLLRGFDIKPTVKTKISAKTGRKQPIIRCGRESYDNLVNLIQPFVLWDCMSHKIKRREFVRCGFNMAKFEEYDVLRIYELSTTHKQYEIAQMYNVHKNTISSLLRGESWQHLSHLSPYILKSVRRSKVLA